MVGSAERGFKPLRAGSRSVPRSGGHSNRMRSIEDDLGDEELVGVQIGAVVPIDAVEAQGQSRQEDDREGHRPDVGYR